MSQPVPAEDAILIFKSIQEFITQIHGRLTGNAINSDTESFACFPQEIAKQNDGYKGYYVYIPKSVTDLQDDNSTLFENDLSILKNQVLKTVENGNSVFCNLPHFKTLNSELNVKFSIFNNVIDWFSNVGWGTGIQTAMIAYIDDLSEYYEKKKNEMIEKFGFNLKEINDSNKNDICKDENCEILLEGTNFKLKRVITNEDYVNFHNFANEVFLNKSHTDFSKEMTRKAWNSTKKTSEFVILYEKQQQPLEENQEVNWKEISGGGILFGKEVAGIYYIATREEGRRKGYGSIVMIALMELAKKRGYKKMTLTATQMGRPLYEKLGFKSACDVQILRLFNNSNK
ncbi:hypothetical protein ABK040_015087 [Willaertia magna]